MKLRSKTLGVIAAVVSLLLASSAPTSATTANTLTATNGSLLLGSSTQLKFGPLWGTPPPCGASTGGITLDITSTSPTTWNTLMTSANMVTSVTASGGDYIAEVTRHTSGSQTGTLTAIWPSYVQVVQNLAFRVDIFAASGAPSCVKGTKRCTVRATFGGLTGDLSFQPSGETLLTGDVIHLGGTGSVQTIVGQTCLAPFAGLINSTATMALELTV